MVTEHETFWVETRLEPHITGSGPAMVHHMGRAGELKSPYRGKDIDRRFFLKTAGKAALGLGGLAAATAYFAGREGRNDEVLAPQVRDFSVPDDTSLPELVMVHGSNPDQLIERTFEALGGISRFIERGDNVVVKPNIGWERFPEQAANTNPELVAAVVSICLRAGAGEVIVTDASCNDANRSYQRSGVGQFAVNAGARVLLPQGFRFREMELGGGILKRWPVYQPFIQADKIINMPIIKHHSLVGVTGSMKNWYGILGGARNLLHQDIHQSIFDLANFMRPTVTIMDAIRVLVRNGPQGGSFDDVEQRNLIIAGTDQVACDAKAITVLGHNDFRDFGFLAMADGVIGNADLSRVRTREIT